MLLVLAVLAVRLVQLQGVSGTGTAYAAQADRQGSYTQELPARRGAILDRDGQPLAMSVEGATIYGDPKLIRSTPCLPTAEKPCTPVRLAQALAPVLGLPVAQLAAQLVQQGAFVTLAKGVDIAVGNQVRALGLVGIGVQAEPRRIHPGRDLAANVVGFTNSRQAGRAGVEMGWDQVLRGRDGHAAGRLDGEGRVIPTGRQSRVEPVPGRDVHLTIDRDLQWQVQQALVAQVATTQAVGGSVIVMDAKTGEVLAMATAPTFDADAAGGSPPEHRNNAAVSELYDPGSVNKVIVAAKALEMGVVRPDSVLTVPMTQQFGDKLVKDAHSHPTRDYTFNGVMIESSNVGTVQVATRLGPENVTAAMREFGFGSKTGIGLPTEQAGIVRDAADWSGSSMGTIPIGQGVSVTAMQVASVYQTLANGGVRVAPTLVRGVADDRGRVATKAPATRRVVSQATAQAMLPMLEGVVSSQGTAEAAMVPGFRVAGKTGTADRYVQGKYEKGSYSSSFSGFAPAEAPRLVTSVVLWGTGSKDYYGGSAAGPAFASVMGAALQDVGAAPSGVPAVMPEIYAPGD